MYVGHLGLGLVAKSRRPDVPLGVFLIASVTTDLLYFSLFHTLPLVALTTAALFLAGAIRFDRHVGLLLAALVVAHLGVDLLTSGIALWPNGSERGFRLYDTPLADFILEAPVIVAGWWVWRRTLPDTRDRAANSMLVLLLVSQALFDAFVAGTANG